MTVYRIGSLKMSRIKFGLLTVTVGYLVAFSTAQSTQEMLQEARGVIGKAVEFVNGCGDKDFTYCLKERALKYMDSAPGNIELTEGVTLREINSETDGRQNTPDSFPPDGPRTRENTIDSLLMDRLTKFLSSHSLEFKLPNSAVVEMKRELTKQEGRKKKKKILLPIMFLFILKAAAVIPVLLGGIAILAFKSLIIGKVALVITALVALKKILENKDTSQNYEVVAHPHYTHSHVNTYDEHHGPYKRSLEEDTHNIAYSAYVSNQQ